MSDRLLASSRRVDVAVFAAAGFIAVMVFLALASPWLSLEDPYRTSAERRLLAPSTRHWLGTDHLGRDVFSRVAHGARNSLVVGVLSVALALVVGVPLGTVGGYLGGWHDRVANAIIETLMAFPSILLALVIVAVLGPSLTNVMLAVGIAQVPHYARQTRASALSIREQDFVLAARASGASTGHILLWHVLPNVMAPALVLATMGLGGAILDAAALSFLGLSGDPNRPEWGSMLTAERERFLRQPWLALAPGLAITCAVLAFNIVGDRLRDHFDPRLFRQ
jgi:peptide/nickel transport system permease protein